MFNLIAAVSKNGVIGINNSIPWKCSADFQHFKKTTMNNVVVMGRKTYESLFDHMNDKSKEPLPGRLKIVITNNPNSIDLRPNVVVTDMMQFHNISSFVEAATVKYKDKNIFVIGGAQIYKLFEGYYHDIYLTRINCNYTGERVDDVIHYLPIKDSLLLRDYELLYTNIVDFDVDTKTSVRYEQWRLRNFIGT